MTRCVKKPLPWRQLLAFVFFRDVMEWSYSEGFSDSLKKSSAAMRRLGHEEAAEDLDDLARYMREDSESTGPEG